MGARITTGNRTQKCKVEENVLNIFFVNFFFVIFPFIFFVIFFFILVLFFRRDCCRFAVVVLLFSALCRRLRPAYTHTHTQECISCVYVCVCYYRNDFKHNRERGTHNTQTDGRVLCETTYASRFHFHFHIFMCVSCCLSVCVCV